MKIRSYVSSRRRALRSATRASERRTRAFGAASPSEARFARSARSASASRSTNTALAAPRESASMPRPPLPANRSSTFAPPTSSSIANSASRTRSDVGRVTRPLGAWICLPPRSPAITRMRLTVTPAGGQNDRCATLSRDRLQRLCAEAVAQRVAEQRVLRLAQLGIGRDDRLGPRARPLQQRRVPGQLSHVELAQARLTRPHQLALAAQLQVDLRQCKAVGVLGQRAQPRRSGWTHQQAAGAMLATPDPPAQLVQLGDPEALGVL